MENNLDHKLNLPCEHYEYEFNKCQSSLLGYSIGGESSNDCEFYKLLFQICLSQESTTKSKQNLERYEKTVLAKRAESIVNNTVWSYRSEPPSDWKSKI